MQVFCGVTGRSESNPWVGQTTALMKDIAQSREDKGHILLGAAGAHQSDPPGSTLERPEPRPNLDIVFLQQTPADECVIDRLGNMHRIEGCQRVLGNEIQSHGFQTGPQHAMIPLVPRDAETQSLLEDDLQGLAQGVGHIDGRGMVVHAIAAPIIAEHGHIQVPAGNLGLSFPDNLESFGRKSNGSQSRRATQAFLRATVTSIDPQAIDGYINASQTGHGIHNQQCAVCMYQAGYFIQGLMFAGAGFGMHDAEGFCPGHFLEALAVPARG